MKDQILKKDRKSLFFAAGILILITWLCYLPSKENQFVNWDDHQYVFENINIDISQPGNLVKLLTSTYASNYHPATMLSLGINYFFSENSPESYHVVNVIFHLLNTLLVFLLVFVIGEKIKLKRKIWLAFITALLFGIHPLHVESVAWVSERKDVLYTFFYLLATLFYIRFLDGRKQFFYYSFALLAFALSLLSKAQAAPLAVSLVLIDYLFTRDLKSRRVILEKIPFFIPAIVFGLIAIKTQHTNYELADKYNYFERFLFASYGYSAYLLKTIVPVNLSAYYSYPKAISAVYYLSMLTVAATIVVLVIFRKKKILVFGILFFIVNILLVIQFFPVGRALMADRYFYVPSIGLFVLIAWGITNWMDRSNNYLIPIVFSFFLLFLSVLTYQRVKIWNDSVSLWESVLRYDDKCQLAWYNLGHYQHYTLGDLKNARDSYDKAIECGADAKTYNNRGDLRTNLGDIDGGIADFNRSISINPDFVEAYYNRGNAWLHKDSLLLAIDDYNRAIKLDSLLCPAMNNRGQVYTFLEEYDKALNSYDLAISRNPWVNETKAFSFFGRGSVLFQKGKYEEALRSINQGLTILPGEKQAFSLKRSIEKILKQDNGL